jgi:hypothetical protein
MWNRRTRRAGHRWALLPVLSVAALLMACGGGSGEDPEAAPDEASTEERRTPIEEFLGETWTGENEAQWLGDLREVDNLVAECMSAQGFEYTPISDSAGGETVVVDGEVVEGQGQADQSDLASDDEYVSEYGYGISTIDAFGDGERVRPDVGNVSELSPEEKVAYDQALRGEWTGYDQWVAGEIVDEELIDGAPPDAGCYGQAIHEVFPNGVDAPEDRIADQFPILTEAADVVESRAQNDPRAVEARGEWADCMADAGHPEYGSPEEAMQGVTDRFEALDGTDAALQQLRDDEVSLAVADADCQEQVDLEAVLWDVRVDHEQEFLDDNRDEMERYRDALVAAQEEGS